jgi:hypothetical protein
LRRPKGKKKNLLKRKVRFFSDWSVSVVHTEHPYTALAKRNFIGRDTERQVTMPPAAAQQVERRPHFVKAPGRDALAVRQHTERLRGADPLVVVPKKCKD